MLFFHIDMFSTIRPSPRHPNQNKAQQKPIELQLVVPSTELELANLQTTREVICFVKAAVWRPNLREDYRIWNNNYPSMHLSKSMSQRQNCKVMMVGYFCCIFASRSDHTKITCFWWWICVRISRAWNGVIVATFQIEILSPVKGYWHLTKYMHVFRSRQHQKETTLYF